jgi:hypothetical protein
MGADSFVFRLVSGDNLTFLSVRGNVGVDSETPRFSRFSRFLPSPSP